MATHFCIFAWDIPGQRILVDDSLGRGGRGNAKSQTVGTHALMHTV